MATSKQVTQKGNTRSAVIPYWSSLLSKLELARDFADCQEHRAAIREAIYLIDSGCVDARLWWSATETLTALLQPHRLACKKLGDNFEITASMLALVVAEGVAFQAMHRCCKEGFGLGRQRISLRAFIRILRERSEYSVLRDRSRVSRCTAV